MTVVRVAMRRQGVMCATYTAYTRNKWWRSPTSKEKPASNVAELETKTLSDLREMARKLDIGGVSGLKKQDLIFKLLQAQTEDAGHILNHDILHIVSERFG